MNTMTNEEQNIAIAEILGWKCAFTETTISPITCYCDGEYVVSGGTWLSSGAEQKSRALIICNIPNYTGCLNACAQMELILSKEVNSSGGSRMPWYRHVLNEVCLNAAHPFCNPEHATAPQRCEAFLRVHNRWVE